MQITRNDTGVHWTHNGASGTLPVGSTDSEVQRVVDGMFGTTSESPRPIPKLTIRRRLRDMDKEAQFDAALDAIPHARQDWTDAKHLMSDDPLFTTAAPALKAALSLSDEQFAELIAPE